MAKASTAELRERGEITIPKKIRDDFNLEPGQSLEILPLGDSALLLTPKRLELAEARRLIGKILKQSKAKPEDVLAGLATSRQEIFDKHYKKRD